MKKQMIKIKILKPIGSGYSVGDEVRVEVDSKKTPIEKFWRDRLKDAEIDNCVEIVAAAKRGEKS